MSEHKIMQEQDDGNWKVVDEDKDYDNLYRRVNSDKLRYDGRKLIIVTEVYSFHPHPEVYPKSAIEKVKNDTVEPKY